MTRAEAIWAIETQLTPAELKAVLVTLGAKVGDQIRIRKAYGVTTFEVNPHRSVSVRPG